MAEAQNAMSRRSFVKTSGALGALALAGSTIAGASAFSEVPEAQAASEETIIWSHCAANCGHCCTHRFHVKDEAILYSETDNTGSDEMAYPQSRACGRGRSLRRWLQSPDRLNYPMKRIGKRGEGKFERISWDEALDTIVSELSRIRKTYGNEAVYIPPATGTVSSVLGINASPLKRLFGLTGGYLDYYGSYSSAQIRLGGEIFYGNTNHRGSNFDVLQEGELVLAFALSPGDMFAAGGGLGQRLKWICEEKGCRVIYFDYRRSDSLCNWGAEWVPIRLGTDAALIAALAYELITNNWVDEGYLHAYCVGYDEESMPEASKGQNRSYKDYILGTGYDMIPKTPEWASKITLVPVDKIKSLAKEIAGAKPLFVAQGCGLQRHSNGETASRSIMLLPQLVGQVGITGTNSGIFPGHGSISFPSMPFTNPVKTQISFFTYTQAIDEPEKMTDLNAGVKNAKGLSSGIKFMLNYGGNSLTNQHADINKTHEILADESKCEFIVCYDVFMSDSQKYADILLPDLTIQEQYDIPVSRWGDSFSYVQFGAPVYEPKFERRGVFEVSCDLAKRMGVYEEFVDGKETRVDWLKYIYEGARKKYPDLPTWEEGYKQGIWKSINKPTVILKSFRDDPVKNPLKTKSGKVEIYSEQMATLAETWELPEGDVISPIPQYVDYSIGIGTPFQTIGTPFHVIGTAFRQIGSCLQYVDLPGPRLYRSRGPFLG